MKLLFNGKEVTIGCWYFPVKDLYVCYMSFQDEQRIGKFGYAGTKELAIADLIQRNAPYVHEISD